MEGERTLEKSVYSPISIPSVWRFVFDIQQVSYNRLVSKVVYILYPFTDDSSPGYSFSK